ncbi:MAG: type II toxin-antitoxin system CcdA family antitoxin [Bacteroidia bacterium]
MQSLVNAPKKATHITLSVDVLNEAKALGINISQACDQYLRTLVRTERERRWQQDHADFVAAYNQTVTDEGMRGGHFDMPRFDVYRNSVNMPK